jgi:hypothetical protein
MHVPLDGRTGLYLTRSEGNVHHAARRRNFGRIHVMRIVKSGLLFLTAVSAAHVAGSYGVELVDAMQNYGLEVPFSSRLAAPVHALPWLMKTTLLWHSDDLLPFWVGYLLPAIGTVGAFAIWRSVMRRGKLRGFEVEQR